MVDVLEFFRSEAVPPDGSIIEVMTSVGPSSAGWSSARGLSWRWAAQSIWRDLTARQRAESEVRASEFRF